MINFLWYSRLNRKCFFLLGWILLTILHMAKRTKFPPENIQILSFVLILLFIFIIRSRCNDIGLSKWYQVGIMIVSFIPFVSFIPNLYLLFKKGMGSNSNSNSNGTFIEGIQDQITLTIEAIKNLNDESIVIVRKLFIVIFCIGTLIMCIVPPYHIMHPQYGERFIGYGTITAPPQNAKNITIDYKRLIFQEVILFAVCGAGYALITINKK